MPPDYDIGKLARGSTMDVVHNLGRSVDAQVDAATGGPLTQAAAVAPRPTMDRAVGQPGESSHNPDNKLPGSGPGWQNAVRGFAKAHLE